MAARTKITARFSSSIFSNLPSSFSLLKHLFSTSASHLHPSPPATIQQLSTNPLTKTPISLKPHKPFFPKLFSTKINSSPSSSDSENSDSEEETPRTAFSTKEIDKFKLPPPYDPFNKRPVIEEPQDPKNLQEIFHKIRTGDGLLNFAAKMFDGLSKDGLTHEALQLFSQMKDGGNMPDVVAHTAVIEAYANAGQAKEASKTFMRMLACGVSPNAYTYSVLIKGIAASGDRKLLKEAKKYVVEMIGKGMRVNTGTYVAVFEAIAKMGKAEEGKEFLEVIKGKGFAPDEKEVREFLKGKRGPEFRCVMDILFGN